MRATKSLEGCTREFYRAFYGFLSFNTLLRVCYGFVLVFKGLFGLLFCVLWRH